MVGRQNANSSYSSLIANGGGNLTNTINMTHWSNSLRFNGQRTYYESTAVNRQTWHTIGLVTMQCETGKCDNTHRLHVDSQSLLIWTETNSKSDQRLRTIRNFLRNICYYLHVYVLICTSCCLSQHIVRVLICRIRISSTVITWYLISHCKSEVSVIQVYVRITFNCVTAHMRTTHSHLYPIELRGRSYNHLLYTCAMWACHYWEIVQMRYAT